MFNRKRPKWVNPLEFLEPELQNLFDLSYFAEPGAVIPTGWNTVQDENILPRLSSRQPKPAVSDVDMKSPEPLDGSDESGSEVAAVTRMADESSEDDSDFPKTKVC